MRQPCSRNIECLSTIPFARNPEWNDQEATRVKHGEDTGRESFCQYLLLPVSSRLTSVVSSHPLPIIEDSSLLAGLRATRRGSQVLRDTCMINGISLQEGAVTAKILDALTKAAKVTRGILLLFITLCDHSGRQGSPKSVPNHCSSQGI